MKLNTHLNKTIALIVCVIVGLVLIHNLFMYEINYGVTVGAPTDQPGTPDQIIKGYHHSKMNDDTKALFSFFILGNFLTLLFIVIDYFRQDDSPYYPRKLEFDPFELLGQNVIVWFITLITYIFDGLLVGGLLVYLIYLTL